MKVLVFSDTHARPERVARLLSLHADADCACYLGDGYGRAETCIAAARFPVYSVAGNCDVFERMAGNLPEERVITLGEHRIYLAHGHTLGVRGGTGILAKRAHDLGCDIALFGHTHIPREEYIQEYNLYLMNPGSLGEPPDGKPSFGLITLTGGGILLSHGNL